jgi:lipid A 4'-phosphatase
MSWSPMKEAILVAALLIAATAVIAVTNADIIVSSYFVIDGQWPIGNQFPWITLYRIDRFPAVVLAVFGLIGCLIAYFRPEKRHWAKPGMFLVILLTIGPGLIVNSLLKEHWGRPRPREIVQFQGKKEFLQPWQKGISGNGRSFPSGHTSAAVYMTAPFFIYRSRNRRVAYAWLTGGLAFAILMSIARIAQGGHFLSDTVWSCGIVYLLGLLFSALFKLDRPHSSTSPPES